MYHLHITQIGAVALCLGSLFLAGPVRAAEVVTVGNHDSCNHASIRDAIDAAGDSQNLQILVQGRILENDPGQQGIHKADLVIAGPRTVVITGDDGSNPLSECTSSNAARRPVISALGTFDVGYKVIVQDGATLVLNNIDVGDTVAGGVQVVGSDLSVNGVEFRNNTTSTGVSGAAIQADSSTIVLEDAGFFGNASPAAGGAIFCTANTSGKITARHVRFGASEPGSGNQAGFDGGAIALHRNCAFETLGGVVFDNNVAHRDGGSIAAAADDGNRIDLRADIVFGDTRGNVATRNGGAISLGAGARLTAEDTLSLFSQNFAGEQGGALHIAGGSTALLLGCENFVENRADLGGAIYAEGLVTVINRENVLLCEPTLDLPPNQYQTMFESNRSTDGGGGAVYATGESAQVQIDQAALIGNDATIPRDFAAPLGSVAYVEEGASLFIRHSLLWANGSEPSLFRDAPTLLQADDEGSRIDIALSTIVENIGAHSLIVTGGARAQLFGVIEFNNDMSAPSSGGTSIKSVCSTLDTGLDPGFIPAPGTHRGRFRLAPDSPMRGFCSSPFPVNISDDLDDIPRSQIPDGRLSYVDAGAFNGNAALSASTRCTTEDDLLGLFISMSGDRTSFNVTGNGPNLPATTNNGLLFLADDGAVGWTDVVVKENNGDQEELVLGDFACSVAELQLHVSGPGLVTSNPSGIDCPTDCSERFVPGQSVSLTATANAGSVFAGWSEPNCGLATVCTVTLQKSRTLAAYFESADSLFNDGFE